jgi:hypothetical protein
MTNTYASRQDFNVQLARMTKPDSPIIREILGRTITNESDALFAKYIHEAMGHRSHQTEI